MEQLGKTSTQPVNPTAPLSQSWRSWIANHPFQETRSDFDVIVVGSGYGGSVAALRYCEKGYRVLLLERGGEYLPGDFLEDASALPFSFRVNRPSEVPLGNPTGIYDFRVGMNATAMVANGLGGGSLVNAGVVIKPDADVFAQAAWPAAFRHQAKLTPGITLNEAFDTASRALGTSVGVDFGRAFGEKSDGKLLGKAQGLMKLAQAHSANTKVVAIDATIDTDKCSRCGNCFSGCNQAGAKLTLRDTYLHRAMQTGRLQIITHANVYRFEQDQSSEHPWVVTAFSTEIQREKVFVAEAASVSEHSTARKLAAKRLIISSGAIGSTELLQRSQALADERLAFSPALGSRFSTNGDSISVATFAKTETGGIGLESHEAKDIASVQANQSAVGPTITRTIDGRDPNLPLNERILVQEGAIPGGLAYFAAQITSTTSAIHSTARFHYDRFLNQDPLSASGAYAKHMLLLLAMGHDEAKGRLVWMQGGDVCVPYWEAPEELQTYKTQQSYFDSFNKVARHTVSPLWKLTPDSASALISGPKPQPHTLSVHPLGGCPMADDPHTGVVNALGQVWIQDPGRPGRSAPNADLYAGRPQVYEGLYVLDASIIPSSLGCNPLLTITALAEYAMDRVPAKPSKHAAFVADRSPSKPLSAPAPGKKVPTEIILSEVLAFQNPRAQSGDIESTVLNLSFTAKDFDAAMGEAKHRFPITLADISLGIKGSPKEVFQLNAAKPSYIDVLAANHFSSGFSPLVISCMELLALGFGAWLAFTQGFAWLIPLFLLAALLFFPFVGTFATYLVLRVIPDKYYATKPVKISASGWQILVSGFKQLVHASETRRMHYVLAAQAGNRHLDIVGEKVVQYRASAKQWWAWAYSRCEWLIRGCPERFTFKSLRPSFWEQIMNPRLEVQLLEDNQGSLQKLAKAKGLFVMDFADLLRKESLQLGATPDTPKGLQDMSAYPLLFLRFFTKTRLLDFRLPSYSGHIIQDNASEDETHLRHQGQRIKASEHWFTVQRGISSSDRGIEDQSDLRLCLRRYAQRDATGEDRLPDIQAKATWQGLPVTRAKVVLMLHAFGQSGLSYTLKTVNKNLAEAFYDEGWEVWILESRMSTRSGYAELPFNVDMMAEHDIPGAVDTILSDLATRLGHTAQKPPLQLAIFGQCIGAASMWMSTLSGKLSHGVQSGPNTLSKVFSMMSSQVHPGIEGSRITQAKTWLPAIIGAAMPNQAIPFSVRNGEPNLIEAFADRLFATMPVPDEEACPHGDEDACATCRRIRFIEAPLYKHRNLNRATHSLMPRLFGPANVRLFSHARRFVDPNFRRLVDQDGLDKYVSEDNITAHCYFPFGLLHGAENELFLKESTRRTKDLLACVASDWSLSSEVIAQGYGHLDVLIGERAHEDVFPKVLEFFNASFVQANHQASANSKTSLQRLAPLRGPFVGWLREGDAQTKVRVSFVVNDLQAGRASPELCLERWEQGQWRDEPCNFTLEDLYNPQIFPGEEDDPLLTAQAAYLESAPEQRDRRSYRFAWADVAIHGTGEQRFRVSSKQRLADRSQQHYDETQGQFQISAPTLQSLSSKHAVRFSASCCRYPGWAFDSTRVDLAVPDLHDPEKQPAFCFLLGDQIYADATGGFVDPTSPTERFVEAHMTAFGSPAMKALLSAMPVYMTPDDHEWLEAYPHGAPLVKEAWPQESDKANYARRQKKAFYTAWAATRAFQQLQTPQSALLSHYDFQHGPSRFFMLDTRLDRQAAYTHIVRPRTMDALKDWIAQGTHEKLSFICTGSVLAPGVNRRQSPSMPTQVDTWQAFPAQRLELLEALVASKKAFVLLSGDLHISGQAKIYLERNHLKTLIGIAIVTPPIYAPLSTFNTSPEAILAREVITLANGDQVIIESEGFETGSGVSYIDVQATGEGFSVSVERKLRHFDAELGISQAYFQVGLRSKGLS